MPDHVLTNARMWTGDPARPFASAAVVRDGHFVFIGDADSIGTHPAKTIDLHGAFVMPGFTDAHVHLLWTGFAAQSVDLKGVPSVADAAARVAARAEQTPAGSWVTGAGWDQNLWPGARFPHRRDLDAVAPDHPVQLMHTSGHASWANSAALRLAGITRDTPAPVGGAIDHDREGEPTGILRDNASKLLSDAMPHPDQSGRIATLRAAIAAAHALGVTGVHAMNVGRGEFQALHALNDTGELRLRTAMFLAHEKLDEWLQRNAATGDGDAMLRVGGVKFFADGALGSLTAWMFEPYETSGDIGFPLQPVEELERDVRRALAGGLAPALHAIGDRANHEALGIFERAAGLRPDLPRRIEHAQLLRPADIPRFAGLGVTASVQPIHATADWRKVDREWGARGSGAYPFAALLASGATLAFGSDTPVESMDPIAGLHAAVTRLDAGGEPAGGWFPAQRLALNDALAAYTAGPAAALHHTASGRIAPGFVADYVVLSGDPFATDPARLAALRVQRTVVGGETVFLREAD